MTDFGTGGIVGTGLALVLCCGRSANCMLLDVDPRADFDFVKSSQEQKKSSHPRTQTLEPVEMCGP